MIIQMMYLNLEHNYKKNTRVQETEILYLWILALTVWMLKSCTTEPVSTWWRAVVH